VPPAIHLGNFWRASRGPLTPLTGGACPRSIISQLGTSAMNSVTHDPAHWHRRADEIRSVAIQMSDAESTRAMLEDRGRMRQACAKNRRSGQDTRRKRNRHYSCTNDIIETKGCVSTSIYLSTNCIAQHHHNLRSDQNPNPCTQKESQPAAM
jgi:hypothetical protein